jgi:hypothetical protein
MVGVYLNLKIITVGLRVRCICLSLYPFSLSGLKELLVTQSSCPVNHGCKNGLFVGRVEM